MATQVLHLTTPEKRHGLSTIVVLTAWSHWRHCNAIIFEKIAPSSASLVTPIEEDTSSWPCAGAKGLGDIIRVT